MLPVGTTTWPPWPENWSGSPSGLRLDSWGPLSRLGVRFDQHPPGIALVVMRAAWPLRLVPHADTLNTPSSAQCLGVLRHHDTAEVHDVVLVRIVEHWLLRIGRSHRPPTADSSTVTTLISSALPPRAECRRSRWLRIPDPVLASRYRMDTSVVVTLPRLGGRALAGVGFDGPKVLIASERCYPASASALAPATLGSGHRARSGFIATRAGSIQIPGPAEGAPAPINPATPNPAASTEPVTTLRTVIGSSLL